jgi:hypothetical protein
VQEEEGKLASIAIESFAVRGLRGAVVCAVFMLVVRSVVFFFLVAIFKV